MFEGRGSPVPFVPSVPVVPSAPFVSITGDLTSILSGGNPFTTRRDFMNSEITTIFLKRAIARLRRACENTRLSAAFHARHAEAQNRHGHIPLAREQLRLNGV